MRRLCLTLLLLSPALACAEPSREFCQGIAIMSGHLQQQLQQGVARPQAIEAVLDATDAPPQRKELRQFLHGMADLVQLIDLPDPASRSFVFLSCEQAGLFGDARAQRRYQKSLPVYLAAARTCVSEHSGDALQRCMAQAFILPSGNQ